MPYTKQQSLDANLDIDIDITLDNLARALTTSTHSLTIDLPVAMEKAYELIASATYYSHGRLRVRLVNSDIDIQSHRPALYNYSPQTIEPLQQVRNVGPWSNEYIANSPHTNYRRLDLYLDPRDIATITSNPDTLGLPALPAATPEAMDGQLAQPQGNLSEVVQC